MANPTLRGLLFKTEIDRQFFLVKVSVDSSLRARSISDLVKLTKIPDKQTNKQTNKQTETSRQEHHSERNKRFAQKKSHRKIVFLHGENLLSKKITSEILKIFEKIEKN